MRFAGTRIEIDELTAIEIGKVLSVWRPRDVFGEMPASGPCAKIFSTVSGSAGP